MLVGSIVRVDLVAFDGCASTLGNELLFVDALRLEQLGHDNRFKVSLRRSVIALLNLLRLPKSVFVPES